MAARPHTADHALNHKTGVRKLMSAVVSHSHPPNLATSVGKFPIIDQVVPSDDYLTCHRTQSVKLRVLDKGMGAEPATSIPTLIQTSAHANPDVAAVTFQSCTSAQRTTVTYSQLLDQIKVTARALISLGLSKQNSVGIIASSSCYEGLICHLATIFAGGISVCISSGLSLEDTARACVESGAGILVVQHPAQLRTLLAAQHRLPQLRLLVLLHGEASGTDKRRLQRSCQKEILSWAALSAAGQALSNTRLAERVARVAVNQCCVVCYGGGGEAGGLMFSHDNITWTTNMLAQGVIRPAGFQKPVCAGEEVVLHRGPLSDISAQIVEVMYPLSVAGTLVIPACSTLYNYATTLAIMREVRPTLVWAPAHFYENMYHQLRNMHSSMSRIKRIILDWYNNTSNGKDQSKLSKVPHQVAVKTLIRKCRRTVGLGSRTVALCRDGGRLPPSVLHCLASCGVTVHAAFGTPETCGLVTANIPKRFCKLGTIGKQLPGVSLKLQNDCDEKSIDVKSRSGFMGYLNREAENKAIMLEEGWLKLGHCANADSEGYIEMQSNDEEQKYGKIEARVRLELGCISQCIVIDLEGGRRGAVLSLGCEYDKDGCPTDLLSPAAAAWFSAASWPLTTVAEVIANIRQEGGVQHCIQAGIDRANQGAGCPSEWLERWEVKTTCLSYQSGELGAATSSVSRQLFLSRYQQQIAQIFSSSGESEAPTAGLLAADTFFAFPSNLSQILEEEERQSSRNSLEKERDGEPEASAAARVGDAESTKVDVNDNNNIDSDIESISIHELPKSDQDKKNIVNESPASSSDEKKTNKRKISRT